MTRAASIVLAVAAGFLAVSAGAQACQPGPSNCRPAVVVFPLTTPEGLRIGTVEAPVRRPVALERSRFTGQPMTVLYNDPGRAPGSISPTVELVPLPHVKPFATQAVYPRGY